MDCVQTREAKHLSNACQWQKHTENTCGESEIMTTERLLFIFTDGKHIYFQNFLILHLKLQKILRQIRRVSWWIPLQLTGWQSGHRRLLQGHTRAHVDCIALVSPRVLIVYFFKLTQTRRIRGFFKAEFLTNILGNTIKDLEQLFLWMSLCSVWVRKQRCEHPL